MIDPQYQADPHATESEEAPKKRPWYNVTPTVPPREEKAMSREPWTTLKFRSASRVVPFYHLDGSGDNDRVLNDAEHGIFGAFDGIGSENATRAAEVTRDFAHNTLLTATKPTSIDEAVRLMQSIFDGARAECKRLGVEGGTTANLSFVVDIDGKHYLIGGNVGDSVLYGTDGENVSLRTTEQLYDEFPSVIFNSISSRPNSANTLSDKQLRNWVFNPRDIDPESTLPLFTVPPKLQRDEVVVYEIMPGMRFVHATDGLSGDKPNERLAPSVFGDALHLESPEAAIAYLFDASIKRDDKGAVAFFAEAA